MDSLAPVIRYLSHVLFLGFIFWTWHFLAMSHGDGSTHVLLWLSLCLTLIYYLT